MGVDKGKLRLKGLLALGAVLLALGYLEPTVGAASGPSADAPGIDFVVRDGNRVTMGTIRSGTVADALRLAGRRLGPDETTNPAPATRLANGMQIEVKKRATVFIQTPDVAIAVDSESTVLETLARAGIPVYGGDSLSGRWLDPPSQQLRLIPSSAVMVRVGGRTIHGRVTGREPSRVLADLGYDPGAEDRVSVSRALSADGRPLSIDSVIDDGTEIELVQITREETRALVRLPFKTRQLLDPNLPAGSRRVDQDGQEGVRVVILEAVFEDGRRVSERLVGTQDLLEPIERVIRVGIKPVPLPADGTHSFVQLIEGSATSYCLTGTTATGTQAGPGSIAVDPSVIKLGSHVYVTGYGFGYAVDTGSAIIGTLVDVWYDCDQAMQWGRRAVTIYVLSS